MKPRPIQQLIFLILTLLTIVIPRWYYVDTYAVSLPFWDQWDAEGDFLLRPWIEETLKLSDLWQPHNEHRIFPTRLLSLINFEISGEWNNLTEARVNIFLAAATPVVLIWQLFRNSELTGFRWIFVIVLIAQFALPFSFENLLIGFQSQFYFLILFTVLALILVSYAIENSLMISGIVLLSVLSIVTMASGLLTPLAVSAVLAMSVYLDPKSISRKILIVTIFLMLTIIGYLIVPNIEANQMYRARNVSEILNATWTILSWPFVGNQWASILWMPGAIMIPTLLFQKKLMRADLVLAGCFIWSLLQAVAISYGRGQQLTEVSSRYTELFSIGIAANAWFAIRCLEIFCGGWYRWTFVLFFALYLYGQIIRFDSDIHDMASNHRYSLIQVENVSNYLKSKNPVHLQKPTRHIPFPDSIRMKALLDSPVLSKILPSPFKEKIRN